jgi:meso-butanediol dehydrogenase/(S,S)-butanediol dehydrogenase/diacetyl reductase
MTDRLANVHVLITGAAGGIGSATARRLASEGASLLLADANGDAATALATELGQQAIQVDVTRGADIQRMIETAYQHWGRLDVLFNNAGIAQARSLLDLNEADWDRVHDVNLKGMFFVLQAAARRMRNQDLMPGSELRGKIINTASIAGYRGGQAHMVHYAASKAGVISVTRTAAQVLAPLKITSNCICPGVVETAMWAQLDEEWNEIEGWQTGEAWKRRIVNIPLGRPETANDVAGVVSFLSSPDADYMTGQAIHVDGGLVMGS